MAYTAACLLTAAWSAVCVWRVWRKLPVQGVASSQWNLWASLLPFSLWVWFTDLATNLLVATRRHRNQICPRHDAAMDGIIGRGVAGVQCDHYIGSSAVIFFDRALFEM